MRMGVQCIGIVFFLILNSCHLNTSKEHSDFQEESSEMVRANLKYAKKFAIEKLDDYTFRVITKSKEGGKVNEYLLNSNESTSVRIVSLSTTLIPFIDQLDAWKNIVGLSDQQFLHKKYLSKVKEYEIQDIGSNLTFDYEKILELNPDFVFLPSFLDSRYDEKFNRLGIKTVHFDEYMEAHPLGVQEWMVFLGAFVGKLNEAEKMISRSVSDYERLVRICDTITHKPTVFAGEYASGYWVVPGAESFVGQFIKDAGGVYVWEDQNVSGTFRTDWEEVLLRANRSDFIRLLYYDSLLGPIEYFSNKTEKYNYLNPFKQGKILYANAYYSDVFGQAVTEPEVVLKDYIEALHPALIDHKQHYYLSSNLTYK